MLTARENLLRVFRHETPEWIPVCAHVDPYNQPSREGMDPDLAEAMRDVRWRDESTVIFSRYLGLDIMDYTAPPVKTIRRKVTCESVQQGDETIETWRTPVGELRQVRRHSREAGTSYLVEHMVKGARDLPALAAVFEDEVLELDPPQREAMRKRADLVGEDGMLMCFMPGTPMGMMYRAYSGVETLAYLYADAPKSLADLFSVMEASYRRRFLLSVDSAGDAFVGMDDTSTTVISPAMFEKFNLDCTNQRARLCHERGKLYFHHSCGLIRDLLPIYRRTAMDAVHAFSVPPIGNVTVAEGRRLLGDRITIITGSSSAMAQVKWDPEHMKAAIRRLFTDAGAGDHFILNIAAYPHRTMEQTRAVVEQCRKYQKIKQ